MTRRSVGWVPVCLLALGAIPAVAGAARLVEILGGADLIQPDARFAAAPAPVVVHVAAAIGYAVLGAFQFSTGIRRRHPAWHRRAGRVLVALGLAVALSALWMTLVLPAKEGTGVLLAVFRLLVAAGMATSLVLGLAAVVRRDLRRHRAWMTRAYALGLGAGTQALTVGLSDVVLGAGVVRHDLAMGTGWVINLAVAEWILRRPAAGRARTVPAGVPLVGA